MQYMQFACLPKSSHYQAQNILMNLNLYILSFYIAIKYLNLDGHFIAEDAGNGLR